MEEQNLRPNGVTLLLLINAAGSLGDYREARTLYDKMVDLGIPLTVEPCSALINAFAKHVRPFCWSFLVPLYIAHVWMHLSISDA